MHLFIYLFIYQQMRVPQMAAGILQILLYFFSTKVLCQATQAIEPENPEGTRAQ